MRSQSLLMVALILIVLFVMGVIIFLPSSTSTLDRKNDLAQSTPVANTGDSSNSTPGNDATSNQNATLVDSRETDSSTRQPNGDGAQNGDSLTDSQTLPNSTDGQSNNPNSATPSIDSVGRTSALQGVVGGIVKDPQGKPLQGAALQLTGKPLILSDAQGGFRFENLQERTVEITAQLGGYQTAKRNGVPVGTVNLEIVLIPEGALAGQVLDQFGEPIALANVRAKALQGIWAVDVNAGADGRFLFPDAPNTSVRLQASQEGYTDSGAGGKEVVLPNAAEIVLRLNRPTFSISGRVISKENQQGVGGFQLRAVLQDAGANPEEKIIASDSTGSYRFDNLRQGSYIVSSMAKENAALNVAVPINQDFKTIRLYERSVSNIDFTVESGRTISGLVVTSDNQPVANANVTIAGLQSVQTTSNFEGNFRLTGVPVTGGQTLDRFVLRLQASHSDYGTGFSDPLPSDAERDITGMRITLQGVSTLSGTVVDRDGSPVSDARLVLLDITQGQSQETRSDSTGHFSFNNVAASQDTVVTFGGTHQITVEKENYSKVQKQIRIEPGRQQTITLTLDRGGFIQGRVLDPSGNPLAGVNVTTQLPRGGVASAMSDPSGSYFLNGLPEGVYDIHFRVDSDPPLTGVLYQLAVGNSGADVTLAPGKWDLMGTVTNAQTGDRVYQYLLSVEGTPKDPRGQRFVINRQINSPDATYNITFTEPGIYRIRFVAPGYQPLEEKADIAADTMRIQYINPQLQPLQTTGIIRGTFAAPEGIVLLGIIVPGVLAYPASENSFLLEDIPAGNHDLIFQAHDTSSGEVFVIGVLPNVTVTASQTTDIGRISVQNLTTVSRSF